MRVVVVQLVESCYRSEYYFGFGAGSSCLEVGCGAGVLGVALCRVKAAVVLLTDGNGAAVSNCKGNLVINNCMSSVGPSKPDSDPDHQDAEACGLPQVICCSPLSHI